MNESLGDQQTLRRPSGMEYWVIVMGGLILREMRLPPAWVVHLVPKISSRPSAV